MKIREISSQFSVLVMAIDPDWGAEAKNSLTRASYENYLITNDDEIMNHLKEKNPHVLVFSVHEISGKLSAFVEKLNKQNPETRIVALCEAGYFEAISSYEEYGFEQFVTFQREGLGERIRSAVDRICEKLYLTYQNEQLLADLKAKEASVVSNGAKSSEPAAPLSPTREINISSRIVAYQSAGSREGMIQKYFELVDIKGLVFFRFLPSVFSFVATQAHGMSPKQFQGVGCQIDGLSMKDLSTQMALGVVPPPLAEVLQKSFKVASPRLQPLHSQGQLEGVFVYSNDLSEDQKNKLYEEYALFALAFAHMDLQKRMELLEVLDPGTEIYNKKYYDIKMQEEMERASRIKQALSLLKISIDDFFEMEQSIGENARDLILKKVAQLIMKSSRTNDIVARTGQNEISALMPHCHRQGAMIRAERIRRLVESSMTLESGLKVSVSIGISEYPTMCKTATELEETCSKALNHISQRGGNKICMSKAPAGHSPEFIVQVDPGS